MPEIVHVYGTIRHRRHPVRYHVRYATGIKRIISERTYQRTLRSQRDEPTFDLVFCGPSVRCQAWGSHVYRMAFWQGFEHDVFPAYIQPCGTVLRQELPRQELRLS